MIHSITRRFLFGIVSCLLLAVPAFSAPAAKHTCRILFLEGPDEAPEKLQLFDGSKCQEVELPRMNLSAVYELPAGPLNLRLLPAVPPDPTKIPSNAPAAVIGEDLVDFYLIVTSDPANPVAPVRLRAIDAGDAKLKPGQMLWFNLTGNQVGGILGTEKLAIQPGASMTVNAPASGDADYAVNLAFRIPGKEQLYPLCETKWHHDPRSRSLAFIVAKDGVRAPRVMVFPDYREPVTRK